MRIPLDKIGHFTGGVIGWLYFRYIFWGGLSEEWSHKIVFASGGLWELYWWLKKRDKFDVVDWIFVCFGAAAIHCVALNSWIYSPIGYGMCLYIYWNLRKTWRK